MKRLLAVIVCAAVMLVACGDGEADPAAVIEGYIAAYNAGDIDGVMAVFTEESVVTGHPMETRMEGLAAIRAIQLEDLNSAAPENAYTISNVEVTGNAVVWDHIWTSSDGRQFCKQGNEAHIEGDKILTWAWPAGGFDCP